MDAVLTAKKTIEVPLSRVEGDLEIRAELDGDHVSNAFSAGVLYRGFEKMMVGRGALDGLVITPRICGICGTAHLTAAVKALEEIAGVKPPPNAVRVRNLALATEHVQSDVRHAFLMFTPDFANPAYRDFPWHEEVVRRYQPFKGDTVKEVINESKRILEIVALLGGQWPHSSFMVPGGVAAKPSREDQSQCRFVFNRFRAWYERAILGCSLDRWADVRTCGDLEAWLDEDASHRQSELGFYIRVARDIGLDGIGRGPGNFISYGQLDLPDDTRVRGMGDSTTHLISPGFVRGTDVQPFSHRHVAEHVAHSRFADYDGGKHPFSGETTPQRRDDDGRKYSWVKAPRYDGIPAETGPLAELLAGQDPLFRDIIDTEGPSAFARELARLVRPTALLPAMGTWLTEMDVEGTFYQPVPEIPDGEGFGATQAARGALGHWVKVAKGKIEHYQIVTPTAWNGSPRDSDGIRGPWEEALVGTPVKDPDNPVEMGHVIRSFDACLVCAVHAVRGTTTVCRKTLGATP